jgi:two-component system cell cycle sensor histidine kinase PleC
MLPRSVFVLLAVSDEIRGPLTSELASAGHVVVNWRPDEPVPPQAVVAIVEGVAGVEAATQASCHLLALLEPEEVPRVLDLVRLPSDYVLTPTRAGEVAMRVTYLGIQPTWRERTMHRLFALAIERTSDVIEVTDPQARFQYVNPAYEKVLGVPRAEALGKTPAQLVRSDFHPPEFWKNLDATLSRGETFQGTFVSKSRAGRHVHFDTTITPIADKSGRVTHHVGVKRDITERLERAEAMLQANRALEQARDAALAASRAKSEFLANMSHELRTPLNAINGFSEIMVGEMYGPLGDPRYRDYARDILNSGEHLLALINDILDMSKIEAGKMHLRFEELSLEDVAGETVRLVKARADAVGVAIALDFPVLPDIEADYRAVKQVLLNLLSNAVKYTPRGGSVTITAHPVADPLGGRVCVSVKDTGIGIPQEDLARLARPFEQVESHLARTTSGTGLGLALTKSLVEMHNGDLHLESTPGEGTTVSFVLPIHQQQFSRTA